VRIEFVDEHGMAEAGIDGGGLFKDFMEHLVKEVSAVEGSMSATSQRDVLGSLRLAQRPAGLTESCCTRSHIPHEGSCACRVPCTVQGRPREFPVS
jgi:hypothetical protein